MSDVTEWDVIVVDDEPDNIGVVELVLGFHNATVRGAESGYQCLQLLKERLPTFLLVDIQMPRMSGYDLLLEIQKEAVWARIPVIAVTAHTMTGDEQRIIAAGFSGYLPKPISAMTLIEDIQNILYAKHGL